MNDFGRRVNSIIIKNLPSNYTESQLEELFSKFGRVVSSKMLPSNPNFDGGCGFINYADSDSCTKAVENMNNFTIDRFTLRVNHSLTRATNNTDRPQNGFRNNGELNEDNDRSSSLNIQSRFNGFRSTGESSPVHMIRLKSNSTPLNTNESDGFMNHKSIVMNIREHDPLIVNKTYCVYLSNLEVPSVIFAATLDDYVSATLLIAQMNKHEQITKTQSNGYKPKYTIGQYCAALFNGDWYRARVLETEENRVHVQYIDWGNTGWCDSILEIRPLPNEYYKDPVLCVKCVLDGVPTDVKLSDEQTNAILEILVLDAKLDMTVICIQNDIPYVKLDLGKRNLNSEICAILPQPSSAIAPQSSTIEIDNFDLHKPEINISEVYPVQLTTVDGESECFHVLLMGDCLPSIMNFLKDWNASKQPLSAPPKSNMLVCAQYEGDDLWYRAWIKNVSDTGVHVYFVDFGNEELVSLDRLTECPDNLRHIPWQSVQIKLANIKLTDEERFILLRDFETSKLNMKILSTNQVIYSVELFNDGKALSEYIIDLRKKNEQQTQEKQIIPKVVTPPPKIEEHLPRVLSETLMPVQTAINELKRFNETSQSKTTSLPQNNIAFNKEAKPLSFTDQTKNNSNSDENLTSMITEQRRQNRLLEQVIAAINTTNALLTQLVQR